MNKEIWYVSVIRDFKGNTENNQVFYGLTFRVKAEDITTPRQSKREQKVMDTIDAWRKISPVKGHRVSSSSALERFEIFDVGTGDIIVMYRVPFEPVNLVSYVN